MEAKKVRKGVWNSFRPCPTSAGHADNKAPTALSRLVFFSSPPPTLPIPQSLWGSSGNLRMEVRSPGYRIRSFTRERERERVGGHWQWRFTKGDGPTWVFSFPVDFLCFNSEKKKKKILLVEEKWLILRIKIFLDQEYLRYAEQTVRTIIVPKLIVVNWCRADEIISAPCSAINASTPNFLPLRNTLCIYIRLWSRKFLINEFFHRYLSVKWIIIVSMFGPFLFMDHALPGSLWSIDVAILRIVYSVSIFLLFFFFHFTSLTLFFSYIEFLSREYFLRLIFEMTMKYIYIFLYIIILIKIIIIID